MLFFDICFTKFYTIFYYHLVTLYAITASYFAGVMVRLMLTFTPVVCVLSAIAFSECFSGCLFEVRETKSSRIKDDDRSHNSNSNENKRNMYDKAGKSLRKIRNESKDIDAIGSNLRTVAFILLTMLLIFFVIHCTWVTSNAYSSPSIVLASYSGDGYVI